MRILSKRKRDAVKQRWPHCAYCRLPYSNGGREFSVDHVVPLFRGGSRGMENLVGACRACNTSKGCRTATEWLDELTEAVEAIEAMQDELTQPAATSAA